MRRRVCALALAGLSIVACSSSKDGGTPSGETGSGSSDGGTGPDVTTTDDGMEAGAVTTKLVGAAGGAVTAEGVALTIPAGALAGDTMITLTSGSSIPAGYTGLSPHYTLGPAGTTLLSPATISIDLTTQADSATIFWSNASGGYDGLSSAVSAGKVSAAIARLGDGFAGWHDAQDDAATPDEAGADAGIAAEAGGPDAGAPDAAPDGSASDAGVASIPDASADGGSSGVSVDLDGTLTVFSYNLRVTALQAWWGITADDGPSPTHWSIDLVVPNNAGTLSLGGAFPSVTLTHYTGTSADAGTADATFGGTSRATGTIDEATTATVQGEHASGTFTATVNASPDAGSPTSHALTNGSYDVVVP